MICMGCGAPNPGKNHTCPPPKKRKLPDNLVGNTGGVR